MLGPVCRMCSSSCRGAGEYTRMSPALSFLTASTASTVESSSRNTPTMPSINRAPPESRSYSRCMPVTSMPSTACATLSGGGTISLTSEIATTGKFLMKSRNHIENQPKLPSRMHQSTYVGAYLVHCHGSNSCESDGSKITKRSNHMPRLMNKDSVNSHVVLRRSFCQKSESGRMVLQVSMIHAAHHHWPNTRLYQNECSISLPPYQPMKNSVMYAVATTSAVNKQSFAAASR